MDIAFVEVPVVLDEDIDVVEYAHADDAGFDLRAHIEDEVVLWPGQRMAISTGMRAAIPPGYELQVRSRSGLALKHGVIVANSPGTVDAGYTGEIKVILANIDELKPYTVKPNERIAQAVLAPVARARLMPVDTLPQTARGEGGFGSTGR